MHVVVREDKRPSRERLIFPPTPKSGTRVGTPCACNLQRPEPEPEEQTPILCVQPHETRRLDFLVLSFKSQ